MDGQNYNNFNLDQYTYPNDSNPNNNYLDGNPNNFNYTNFNPNIINNTDNLNNQINPNYSNSFKNLGYSNDNFIDYNNIDKLLHDLKSQNSELENKAFENIQLREQNKLLSESNNNLEGNCVNLRNENEYNIFILK